MGKVGFLYHDKLGLTGPLVRETDHLMAHGNPLHALTDSGNDPCQVTALPRRKCGRPPIGKQAFTDACLTWINTGGLDIDKGFPRTRLRSLNIDDLQHFDPAILIKPDCFGHNLAPSSHLSSDFLSLSRLFTCIHDTSAVSLVT
jgi:hypothetical protein